MKKIIKTVVACGRGVLTGERQKKGAFWGDGNVCILKDT